MPAEESFRHSRAARLSRPRRGWPTKSKEWIFKRRQRALTLRAQGVPVVEIARRLRCARSAIYYWLKHSRNEGCTAGPVRSPTGRPSYRAVADRELAALDTLPVARELYAVFKTSPRARRITSAVWPAGEPLPEAWTPELKKERLEKLTGRTYRPAVAAEMLRQLDEMMDPVALRKRNDALRPRAAEGRRR